MSDEAYCPECGSKDGDEGTVCEACLNGVMEALPEPDFDSVKELENIFAHLPAKTIGEGKRKATEVAEHIDSDELKYMAKYGLSKDGTPKEVNHVMSERESQAFYDLTLSEGFEMLDGDGDDPQSGLSVMPEQSGFNDW